jgi:DNA-binding NtrC family response regulator
MILVHLIPPSQRRIALLAAETNLGPLLIRGASGTGKGALARWIHDQGPKKNGPWIEANRKSLFLDQLPQAHGGTLLIPELGEWPLSEQKRIHDFIKTHSVPHPQGGTLRTLLQVRIIATTSQSLDRRAEAGLFSADLLRLFDALRIEMPLLSQREEEFEQIAQEILAEVCAEVGARGIQLEQQAFQKLLAYEWPGNLRELRNVLKLASISAQTRLNALSKKSGTPRPEEFKMQILDFPDFGHEKIDFRSTRQDFEKIYLQELIAVLAEDRKVTEPVIDQIAKQTGWKRSQVVEKLLHHGLKN